MKKTLTALFALSFIISSQIPASAANVTLKGGKAVTVTFSNTVTLKKSGCQVISAKYTIGKMPEIAFVAFSILDDSDVAIANTVFYKTPGFDDKVWKKNGTFKVKFCRSDWSEDFGDGNGAQNFIGAKKGTYQVYLVVSGRPSVEEFSTITFK